jgi:hypothetical protein
MRILNAKKSKYYDAALSNFEDAKNCYARAGLDAKWKAVVDEVRQAHHRKVGFMGGFERLVSGQARATSRRSSSGPRADGHREVRHDRREEDEEQ